MRPITLDDHPDNICVFSAKSLAEALLKGDAAYREGYQAAIWSAPGQALAKHTMPSLSTAAVQGQPSDLQPHYIRAAKLTRQFFRESYKMPAPGLDRATEQSRFAGLPVLRLAFQQVIAEGRCQMHADYAPHTDIDPYPEVRPQPENIFEGKHVKILRVHNVAGTYAFDDRDKKRFDEMGSDDFTAHVLPKWYIPIGDVAIFQDDFLHSAASFKLEERQTPRVIDIQDCSGGIPLDLVRKMT
jgi:hypothetical protein